MVKIKASWGPLKVPGNYPLFPPPLSVGLSEVTATDLAHITYQPPPLQLNIRGYDMHASASLKRAPDTMQTMH